MVEMVGWLESWKVGMLDSWKVGWSESQKVRKSESWKVGWSESQKVRKSESWKVGMVRKSESQKVRKSESQKVRKSESQKVRKSDSLVRIVRMIRFRYNGQNAIVRIIRLATWNAQEFWLAFLGPSFHSIELFISLTLSAPQKESKFLIQNY